MSELIDACLLNNTKLVLNLIENKANLDVQNKYGDTALMWSCANNNTEIALKLIENKANIDLQDNYGWTALMWSCWNNTYIINYLLEYIDV